MTRVKENFNKSSYIIYFYVAYPYYFPHFIPISQVFKRQGHQVVFVLSEKQNTQNMEYIAKENKLEYKFGEAFLFDKSVDAVFFGSPYEKAKKVNAITIFMDHGLGPKFPKSYIACIEYFDIYLTEGTQKYNQLKRLYPDLEYKVENVGFSKFDGVINLSDKERKTLLTRYGLNKNKKIILYAPTFFPSSIERMKDDFPKHFPNCSILVKPHYLSYERDKYRNQLEKFRKWERYDNCIILPLEEYNIVPFLAISDIMISDESSTMFEFASLNKPVISNQYFKLRWSYHLMPWRLSNRIDSSKARYRKMLDNAYNYEDTLRYVREALQNPKKLEGYRLNLSKELSGENDGKVSERISKVVLDKINSLL